MGGYQLQALMEEDPNFLKHDFEYILVEESGLDINKIKLFSRQVAVKFYGLKNEEQIKEFQDKYIKVYSQTPFFHVSPARDTKFSPRHASRHLEQGTFAIPDGYMTDGNYTQWCELADKIVKLRD